MARAYGRAELLDLGGYWGRLSDEELLRKTFTTPDPEGLPHVCMEVPPLDPETYIEFAYDFRGTKHALIHCVHCKHATHRAGFVIRISDGRRYLVGKNCGAKLYGAHFDTKRGEFEAARSRALLLRRMERLRENLPEFLAYLRGLRSLPAIQHFSAVRKDLFSNMPRLCGELEIASRRHNGELLVAAHIRDFDAEEHEKERYQRALAEWQSGSKSHRKKVLKPKPPKLPITKAITERVGYVATPTFFGSGAFRASDLNAVIDQFEHLAEPAKLSANTLSLFGYKGRRDSQFSEQRSAIVSMDMAETLKQANILLGVLEELIGKLCEPIRLFHRPVLENLCRWAKKHPGLLGEYAVIDGQLHFTDDNYRIHKVGLPKDYIAPSTDGIEKFRRAINMEQ